MSVTTIIFGAAALVIGLLGFWIALPRDGQVRSFLRNDDVQAYYVVITIVVAAMGAVSLLSGLVAALPG
jgi:hypothetical protein